MPKIAVGDEVTCRTPVTAYYSGYAGRPVQQFMPGMIGRVAKVDSSGVWTRHSPGNWTRGDYILVDFVGTPYGTAEHTIWRVALVPGNVRKI